MKSLDRERYVIPGHTLKIGQIWMPCPGLSRASLDSCMGYKCISVAVQFVPSHYKAAMWFACWVGKPNLLTNLKASRATCTITKVHNNYYVTVHYWHPLDKRLLKNNISAKIVLSFGSYEWRQSRASLLLLSRRLPPGMDADSYSSVHFIPTSVSLPVP